MNHVKFGYEVHRRVSSFALNASTILSTYCRLHTSKCLAMVEVRHDPKCQHECPDSFVYTIVLGSHPTINGTPLPLTQIFQSSSAHNTWWHGKIPPTIRPRGGTCTFLVVEARVSKSQSSLRPRAGELV